MIFIPGKIYEDPFGPYLILYCTPNNILHVVLDCGTCQSSFLKRSTLEYGCPVLK